MSSKPEDFMTYLVRKIGEIEELVVIAKNHPTIVTLISIQDTIAATNQGMKVPIIRISLELNEQQLRELRKKV